MGEKSTIYDEIMKRLANIVGIVTELFVSIILSQSGSTMVNSDPTTTLSIT